jgi:hypothetical protein
MGFPTQGNREIGLSGGRENNLVPSTVARWYDFREPGGYLGNAGLTGRILMERHIAAILTTDVDGVAVRTHRLPRTGPRP